MNFFRKNELSCYKNYIYHWNTHDVTFSTMYHMLNDDNAEESCQLLNFIDLLCYPSNKFRVKMKFFIPKSSENYKSWFSKKKNQELSTDRQQSSGDYLFDRTRSQAGETSCWTYLIFLIKNMILIAIFASLFIFHIYQKYIFVKLPSTSRHITFFLRIFWKI